MSTFWQKYKDPRWQKLRLEKMQQASFSCEHCRSTAETLHVHHKIYRKNHDPWDYELFELDCLCESCHGEHHELNEMLKEAIVELDRYAFHELVGFAQALALKRSCEGRVRTQSPMHADGISAAFAHHDMTEVLNLPHQDFGIDLESLWGLYALRRNSKIKCGE